MRKLLLFAALALCVRPIIAQTTFLSDSFTDTAGVTLEAHTASGVTWTKVSSSTNEMLIRSGGGVRQDPGSGQSNYVATAPASSTADYTFAASILPQAGTSGNISVGVRTQSDGTDGYFLLYQSANVISIFKLSGGGATYTEISSEHAFTPTTGTAFTLEVDVAGSSLTGKLNGSTIVTATDSTYASGTPSLFAYNTDSTGTPLDTHGFAYLSVLATQSSSGPVAPTITFYVAGQTYPESPFAVSATSNSSGAITYSVVSGPATISGSTVTLTAAGTVVLQASQAAAGGYTSGTQNATFSVSGSLSFSAAANDASWLYSPYNWATGTYASGTFAGDHFAAAVNPGAYIRQLHVGATSAVLYFDASNLGSFSANDIPHVAVRVDNGPWTKYAVAATINISAQLNPYPSSGQQHLLEVVFSSVGTSTSGQERFSVAGGAVAPVASVIFLGVVYNSGASWLAPPRRPKNALLFGDSITEAVDALGNGAAASYPGIYNDATLGWCFGMAAALDAEVGCVGFSGQAVTNTSYFNHAAPSTYPYIFGTVARNFASPAPDVVMFDWGTNDGGGSSSAFSASIQAMYTTIVAAAPSAKFAMWEDYRAQQTAGEVASMTAIGGTLITGLLSGGFMTNGTIDSYDGNHPTATTHATKMLPVISSAINALLAGATAASRGVIFH